MSNRVQVQDSFSKEVLFECNMEELDLAYQKAHELEEMGLNITIQIPGVQETLMDSLGAGPEDIALNQLINEDESCSHYNCESRF